MKTKLIKVCLLTFTLITFFGCCKECESELDEIKKEMNSFKNELDRPFEFSEPSPTNRFDFCGTDEAITGRNKHNTITGVAYFTIPIPRGSDLKLLNKTKNKIEYICTGRIYSNDVQFINRIEPGLSRKESDTISIEVTFRGFENRCVEGDIQPLQEKKKGSVIIGDPFAGSNSKD